MNTQEPKPAIYKPQTGNGAKEKENGKKEIK